MPLLIPGGRRTIPLTTNQATIGWMQRIATPADNGFNTPITLTGGYNGILRMTVPSTGLTEFSRCMRRWLPPGNGSPSP